MTSAAITLTEYRRTLGASYPSPWVRVDSDDIPAIYNHLSQYSDELYVERVANDDGTTHLTVCGIRHKRILFVTVDSYLHGLTVEDLMPYVYGWDVSMGETVNYWGWDEE